MHHAHRFTDSPTSSVRSRSRRNYLRHAEGSVLITAGGTHVICTASVEDRVPPFLRNTGKGWITAEYGMLPRATNTRTTREASTGKVGGRTQEIQRLIGRSLRSVAKLDQLGRAHDLGRLRRHPGRRRHAHGGDHRRLRRARAGAAAHARAGGQIKSIPVQDYVAATSVGIIERRADARPRLRRGLARRRRHERRADRRRPLHRAAGHGRSGPVRTRRARRAARRSPTAASASSSRCSARSSAGFSAGDGAGGGTCSPRRTRTRCARFARCSRACPSSSSGLDAVPGIAPPEETGATFAENARLKALYYARATGLPAIADDSGLEIDALNGAPGIESARFGGVDSDLPREVSPSSTTRFAAAAARKARRGSSAPSRSPTATPSSSRRSGTVEGYIAAQPAGTRRLRLRPDLLLPALRLHARRGLPGTEGGREPSRRGVQAAAGVCWMAPAPGSGLQAG